MQTLSIGGRKIVLRSATWEEIVDLRHAVLRQGLAREAAIFEGDDSPSSRHCGAFDGALAVGCATMHASRWEDEPAWQLRGMATVAELRGMGLGRTMLEGLEASILADAQEGASLPLLLWCNAPAPAIGFYKNLGWRAGAEQFPIP